jgi:spoIIIJ-associated protein
MDYIEITAKTLDEAITEACKELMITSERLDYLVIEEGSNGLFGLGSKQALIKARVKNTVNNSAVEFLNDIFTAMKMNVTVNVAFPEGSRNMDIDLSGDEMGVLIGKRGQTLDSLQFLTSLVVNKESNEYIRVKIDTENYRNRRKETLENLAKGVAYKVKKSRRPISLEPMNPYERRVIHSFLQGDKAIMTYSEGEEPFRRVVVSIKR